MFLKQNRKIINHGRLCFINKNKLQKSSIQFISNSNKVKAQETNKSIIGKIVQYKSLKNLKVKNKNLLPKTFYGKGQADEIGLVPSKTDKILEDMIKTAQEIFFVGLGVGGNGFMLYVERSKNDFVYRLKIEENGNILNGTGKLVQNGNTLTGDFLFLEKLEDCKRWRFVYNGYLTMGMKKQVVRFNFFYKALHSPFVNKRDFSPWSLAALPEKLVDNALEGWNQWGVMHGLIVVGDGQQREMYLRGLRGVSNIANPGVSTLVVCDEGIMLNFCKCGENIVQGNLFRAGQFTSAIVKVVQIENKNTLKITDEDNRTYTLDFFGNINVKPNIKDVLLSDIPSQCLQISRPWPAEYKVKEGHLIKLLACDLPPGPIPSVVSLDDGWCQHSVVVGGKASSLSLIRTFTDLHVPAGICITRNLWAQVMNENKKVSNAIKKIECIICEWPLKIDELQKACEVTIQEIICLDNNKLVSQIEEAGQPLFNGKLWESRFAVRSSAIGEDGKNFSFAGQNKSFLGVVGKDAILRAIRECWASLFTFRSVEYRRQNGLSVWSEMCVLIQEMVPAEVSGVIFTADPVTGLPGNCTITANWGLGESVVSASADPDTVKVSVNDGLTCVQEVIIGNKSERIDMEKYGGISTKSNVDIDTSSQCCLNEETSKKLGLIGMNLENTFGAAQDIEFSISSGKIYILQSRPITTINQWSDWELEHEFDSAKGSKSEINTTANVGEGYPGAISPLTQSTVLRGLDLGMQFLASTKVDPRIYNGHNLVGVQILQHRPLLNVLDFIHRFDQKKLSVAHKAVDFAVFGGEVTTQEDLDLAHKRHKSTKLKTNLVQSVANIVTSKRDQEKTRYKFKCFSIDQNNLQNSLDLHSYIESQLNVLPLISYYHCRNSEISSTVQLIIFMIFVGKQIKWDSDFLSKISQLFTVDNDSKYKSESGDVPFRLGQLEQKIRTKKNYKENFINVSSDNAHDWLLSNVKYDYEQFMLLFGHRCIKEGDFLATPWSEDPTTVIKTLQGMAKRKELKYDTVRENRTDAILKNLSFIKRLLIKNLLPLSHQSVAHREETKSILIQSVHQFRKAYRQLGRNLLKEGKIPDPLLIYFLTHDELGQIINGGSPFLIQKAQGRQRLFPKWDKLHFDEMIYGSPPWEKKEIVSQNVDDINGISAIPASSGIVRAKARVVLDLEEASNIVSGEILITHSTDIGWSPFFPMLGGVVTELGGLISHGAVVAREFRLPCLVSAKNATTYFTTGDLVELNTETGTIVKIK